MNFWILIGRVVIVSAIFIKWCIGGGARGITVSYFLEEDWSSHCQDSIINVETVVRLPVVGIGS